MDQLAQGESGRTALLRRTSAEFRQAIGRPPTWAWWVPGRIEIFGKHTDYAGGRSLVCAVTRGFAIVAGPRTDGVVTARDARWSTAMELHQGDTTREFHGWANYIAVATRRLALNFPGAPLGADLVFASDLPRAAGMSSSSALVVAVALALIRRGELDQRPEWKEAIHDRLDLAGYLGAVENGLTFRTLAGLSGVGTHGGSEDHTAILNGASERVSAFAYVPVRPAGDAPMPANWTFVVMTSGVEAAKAGAARERYNRASLATRAIVDAWRRDAGVGDESLTLAGALARANGAEEVLRAAIRRDPGANFSAEALEQRLSHFIAEDARVLPALEAFRTGDRGRLGDLSSGTQADAEHLLQNQVPQTSVLAALARESGAFASSSFGAGFGGSVWALTDVDGAPQFLERWKSRYVARFPDLTNITGAILRPGPAAVEMGSDRGQT